MNLATVIAELTEVYKRHGNVRVFASDIVSSSADVIREVRIEKLEDEEIAVLQF